MRQRPTRSTSNARRLVMAFGVLAAFVSAVAAEPASAAPPTSVDLSTYVRVGRYDLPEPTRTTAPTNSLLAKEVSAVTYNWDTDSLFVVGDAGTSIVQVSKTGALIDSMNLSIAPAGTEFRDPEGLAYIGGGTFVMTEERERRLLQFTYAANTTLSRAAVPGVKLGTTVGNIGLEGVSFDPQTSGFIPVKESGPLAIFQTGADFVAGTATNGSATTVNSVDLFDPALAGVLDFADVFALSNIPSLAGGLDSSRLLVLSQESGKIVSVDRAGAVSSSLTIMSDPGNPLSVPDQQHEGLTMDRHGNLYVTSENGGGSIDRPQLWVYAPSTVANQAPTAITLSNQVSTLVENSNTTTRIKVADITVTDDGLGSNVLTLSGVDAASFEIVNGALFLRAGTVLDFETKTAYSVAVYVDDSSVGVTPDASGSFILTITNVIDENPVMTSVFVSEVAPWSSGNSALGADWFEVTNRGTTAAMVTGWKVDDSSNSFGSALALNGVASIAPGESVVFVDSANPAAIVAAFKSLWFGTNPSASVQIGTYTGAGIGLSTGGDAVNLYNAGGALQASVSFGASTAGPFATFDNAAGLNGVAISTLSIDGINGAFVGQNGPLETGSPGRIANPLIVEVPLLATSAAVPLAFLWGVGLLGLMAFMRRRAVR